MLGTHHPAPQPERLSFHRRLSLCDPDVSSFLTRKFHLKPNWVLSSSTLGVAGSQGLKPVARVAPSPSLAPSPPLGAAPGASVPETGTREEEKKWACFSGGQSTEPAVPQRRRQC